MSDRKLDCRLPRRVAARISAEMYRRRMTGRHLAIRAGIDERTVRNVLSGKDAKLTTIESIAAVLHVEVTELIAP